TQVCFDRRKIRLCNRDAYRRRRLMIRKGRFNKPAAEIAHRYGESVSFDWRLIATTSPGRSRMPRRSPAPESFPLPSCVGDTLVRRLATGAPSRDTIAEQIQRVHSAWCLTDEFVCVLSGVWSAWV